MNKIFKISKVRKIVIILLAISTFALLYKYNNNKQEFEYSNYYLSKEELEELGYLVNSSKCQIFNMTPFHPSVLPLLKYYQIAKCPQRKWTYSKYNKVMMNKTAINEDGYPLSSISCCYRGIRRIDENHKNFPKEADKLSYMLDECVQMEEINEVKEEFIKVFCRVKYWPYFFDIPYVNFHALALPSSTEERRRKVYYWENKKDTKRPMNILILGMDSMSRLNFIRNMPKSRNQLIKMGAYEMLGYTKAGENTFPNTVKFLSGYSVDELTNICFRNDDPQDDCPYIWKDFHKANYLTSLVEDEPILGMFNYLAFGFLKPPVDFYMRPLMLHAYGPLKFEKYTLDCIGNKNTEEFYFNYIRDITLASDNSRVPYFIHSWLTQSTHDSKENSSRDVDVFIEDLLKNLNLNNTLMLFLSDHGYRYGEFRLTATGLYEDFLPYFWLYLPDELKAKYPSWDKNIGINTRRLTSPLDIYKTLVQVLTSETSVKVKDAFLRNGTIAKRKDLGISLFEQIPLERDCEDAGIPDIYCSCSLPQKVSLDNPLLEKAAQEAISKINSYLPPQCSVLSLLEVKMGGKFQINRDLETKENSKNMKESLIVGFVTSPGNFIFETNAEIINDKILINGFPSRVSKMKFKPKCIKEKSWEQYCYC